MSELIRIIPVEKPKSFADVEFTESDWKAAWAKGAVNVFPGTAIENIRLSRGLYQFEAAPKQEVDLKVGGMALEDMSSMELKLTAIRLGVTIRKKNIKKSDLVALVKAKLEEVVVEDDEIEVEGGEE